MNLHGYLDVARRQVRLRRLARGAALLAVGGVVLTAATAWLIVTLVPAAAVVRMLTVLLYVGIAAGAGWAMLRRPPATSVVRELEQRVPEFEGRLVTWLDGVRRGEESPLFALLTRQAAAVAQRHPVRRVVPPAQLALPAAVAALALVVLGWLLSGAHPLQLAAQRLWAGDLLAGTRPHIEVEPGDVLVRRGSDVLVRARARGFLGDDMTVHAAFGSGPWEQAPMDEQPGQDGPVRGFVFVGVAETVDYYVTSRGLASPRHRIRVADLPRVTDVALTYHLPAWTGAGPRRRDGGDLTVLPGTRVEVAAVTEPPLPDAALVVDGEARPMTGREGRLAGEFQVNRPGAWHVAVRHQGELVRISDGYLLELAEDAPPRVAFEFPGSDRRATPIEEVVLGFTAGDDHRLESLALHYAVNGGAWQTAPIAGDAGEHVLALEDLRAVEKGAARPLAPGDVIAFYGEARDHAQMSRTALYFVDVRPFELGFRESQQMGGQGAAEGGGLDVAERQRDILSATWNLINDGQTLDAAVRDDRADVLAMLQRTLRDQVETLLMRSRARGLDGEASVSPFLQELEAAIEHMERAAARLESRELDEAVPAERQALKHLVTAESSVREVEVSLGRSDGRGTAGRSLEELIELELDPERNRYEMPQQANLTDDGAPAADPVDWQRLDELAARQERLARRQAAGRDAAASRWEQARLERELEDVRRQLAASSASTTTGSAADRAGTAAPAGARERIAADLEAAQAAVRRQNVDPAAAEQAGEALRRAAERLREAARGDLEQQLSRAAVRAANLNADQDRVMEALDELQRSSLEQARDGGRIGRTDYAMHTFGSVKRRMQRDLGELRRELAELGEVVADADPDTARLLERAVAELDDTRLDERLAAAAEAFEVGQPLYVIGSESLVARGLTRLEQRLAEARERWSRLPRRAQEDPLQTVRSLRRRLTGAAGPAGLPPQDELAAALRALDRLAPAAELRQDGAGGASRGGLPDLADYEIRGTAAENDAALYRLTLERLDLIEAALERGDAPPVRAQEPRSAERDADAAARYFRELSRRTTDDG